MNKTILFDFNVDKEARTIRVDRSFDAPRDLVWAAWTESDILDQWWAPKPYRNVTLSMNFVEGGRWHYYMISPKDEKHYCLFDYHRIIPETMYAGMDAFCDIDGNISESMPRMQWENSFEKQGDTTVVHVLINFNKIEDLEAVISMGFKEGFSMGMENLDAYIASQFYLRKSKKTSNAARVCTYLNFPGNTEDAMLFYKGIFKTEFVQGIQRFGDVPSEAGAPPVPDALKQMVLHVELPLIGGHILMATDAPQEMGFEVKAGNNMHISLEPDSKEETTRIFNALAEGGNITMELQDMFWGAYYGSCTDKYGINWMLNFQQH
ncbi:MAG TPA: SRPBCC domain-containing protein [Chitinophagales bacterium]|nr:SRPBCC domain-containing protein [Chitinophagales bacterium]